MKSVVNFLLGIVVVTAQGAFPERLLNLCAQERLTFWGLVWRDEHTFTISLRRRELKRLEALARRLACTLQKDAEQGLPAFLLRFRRRYAFLAGLGLSLAAVGILSNVIFTVQVTGNIDVPTAQILGELRRLGLRPGAYGPSLELKQISQEALLALNELSWLNVNLYGTRAEVIVREAIEAPELIEEGGCYDIVAKADGLVTEVEPMNGEPLVEEGDTILAGDVLITGNVSMKPPMYSDLPVRYFQTRARGNVWARTWRTLTANIPLTAAVKSYTGEEVKRYSLTIFAHRLVFLQNSSISLPFYDKITSVYPLTLPGGLELPVLWTVERCREYEPAAVEVDREAAQTLLEGRLEEAMAQAVGKDGEITAARYSARVQDGWLMVTMTAECSEQVGKEVPADYGPAEEETVDP